MIELFLRAELFMPDDYQKTIFDIDFTALKKLGVNGLLIDVDNTLIPYDENLPGENLIQLFQKIRSLGFSIMIISNNHVPRIRNFAEKIHCPFIAQAKKPMKSGFIKAIKSLHIADYSEICVIGDQLMTDIYGARRLGLKSILVDAVKRNNEKWFTRLNRRIEKRMLVKISRLHPKYYDQLKLVEKR